MDEIVKPLELLKQIAEKLNVPYGINSYRGKSTEFVVYTLESVSGECYADNYPTEYTATVKLNYIQPANKSFEQKIFDIMDLLIDFGFTHPMDNVVYDDDRIILQFTSEIAL